MTREEQKKLKELNKSLPKMLQNKIKKYKFKKIDYAIWSIRDSLFFSAHIHISVPVDGKAYVYASESVKPLWLDDLFWEIFQMEENKSEPYSLRATGAYVVRGSQIFEDKMELLEWSIDELDKYLDACLRHFCVSVQECSIDDFYNNIDISGYHGELRNTLSLIYNQKYQQALDSIDSGESGCFINGNLNINKAMIEFCRSKLSN